MMTQIRPQKSRRLPALAGLALTLSNSANAEVIVYFEQDGPDVTASWTGSIDPGRWFTDLTFSSRFHAAGPEILYNQSNINTTELYEFGSVFRTAIPPTVNLHQESTPSFGFQGRQFFLPGIDDDSPPAFNVFEFDPGIHVNRFPGQTLAGMRADNFDNTLVWRSSAGGTNTVSYTSGPVPTAVPEPSSALLGFLLLGTSCLLSRRR